MGLAEENAILEAQVAYFASDERIKERAAQYRDMTPEACLAEVIEACREAAYYLAMKSPSELARILEPETLPADTIEILEHLQRAR